MTVFTDSLEYLTSSPALLDLLSLEVETPLQSSDEIRSSMRDLLRHGGFKPTGRSKPVSEYLIKASEQNALSPINLAVDACNAVSLHSGLPISVVDLGLVQPPFRVGIAPPESSYVFNPSGQTIDICRRRLELVINRIIPPAVRPLPSRGPGARRHHGVGCQLKCRAHERWSPRALPD